MGVYSTQSSANLRDDKKSRSLVRENIMAKECNITNGNHVLH